MQPHAQSADDANAAALEESQSKKPQIQPVPTTSTRSSRGRDRRPVRCAYALSNEWPHFDEVSVGFERRSKGRILDRAAVWLMVVFLRPKRMSKDRRALGDNKRLAVGSCERAARETPTADECVAVVRQWQERCSGKSIASCGKRARFLQKPRCEHDEVEREERRAKKRRRSIGPSTLGATGGSGREVLPWLCSTAA